MLLFRSEEHVERWCRTRGMPGGATLWPEVGWMLARAWYGRKLDPEWRRHTLEEAENLLASLGLQGDFWRLRT